MNLRENVPTARRAVLPLAVLLIFTAVGVVVAGYRENHWYAVMFTMIGVAAMASILLTRRYPRLSQSIRLIQLSALGIFFFTGLSLRLNVNFQFPQVIFDAAAGVVGGALIQLLIARAAIPLLFGNGFCSRACWDAVIFEWTDPGWKGGRSLPVKKRSEILAWGYLAALVLVALITAWRHNPVRHDTARLYWMIGENVLIVGFGVGFTGILGRRAYCRLLCPFLTLSGIISRFSVFKITPVKPGACLDCGRCNLACPMMVDVMGAVRENRRVRDRQCILCERCADACPAGCIAIAAGNPFH
ncbi:MAG: 4Fe-4S binding protein [Thermodesulfobacteriota bacterium]